MWRQGAWTSGSAMCWSPAFIKTLPTVRRVEILPYHTLGLFKWQNLGIPYPLDGVRVPTAEEVETAEQLLHVRDYPDAPKGSTAK